MPRHVAHPAAAAQSSLDATGPRERSIQGPVSRRLKMAIHGAPKSIDRAGPTAGAARGLPAVAAAARFRFATAPVP